MVPKPPQATKGKEFPFGNPFPAPVRGGKAGNGNLEASPFLCAPSVNFIDGQPQNLLIYLSKQDFFVDIEIDFYQ